MEYKINKKDDCKLSSLVFILAILRGSYATKY